jgi:hypothetical protein
MLKTIQNIIKPKKRPTVADCVAALEALEAKLAVLLPKELQYLTVEQWRSFAKGAPKPEDEPQTVTYKLEDGTVVVVDGVVPPLALVGGSAALGYVVLADKFGTRRQVQVNKPSISFDE